MRWTMMPDDITARRGSYAGPYDMPISHMSRRLEVLALELLLVTTTCGVDYC